MMVIADLDKPVVGVDLGGTKILAAVVDQEGRILGRSKKKTKAERGAMDVLGRMSEVIREAVENSEVPIKEIVALGIGSPGPLDPETGIVITAPNLGWKNLHLKDSFEGEFNIPTFIDNDVNVGTLGEHQMGAGQGIANLVGIFIGTGIGGGIILNHQLFHGFNKTAGEIGHLIIEPEGPVCGCGNQGCLEAVASRTAINRIIKEEIEKGRKSCLAKEVAKKPDGLIKSRLLAECLQNNDKLVTEVLMRATRYLGIAVGGLINFLNPEMIILGGGVIEAMEDFFLLEVRKNALEFSFHHASSGVRVVAAQLGDDAGVLGAAIMARQRVKEQST